MTYEESHYDSLNICIPFLHEMPLSMAEQAH